MQTTKQETAFTVKISAPVTLSFIQLVHDLECTVHMIN